MGKLDRIRLKENKIGVLESKSIIGEDFDTGTLAWMHPYPLKIIFMNQRVPWIHHVKEESKWKKIWEETDGIIPLSRVVGRFEHRVEPGKWKLEYDEGNKKK